MMIEYVLGFMFNPDKSQVLLIEKIKPDFLAGKLNGIGGKIEPNELPKSAMSREFYEETGIGTSEEQWDFKILHKNDDFMLYIYSTTGDITQARQMEKEKLFIVDLPHLPDTIMHNLRWIIPLILDDTCVFPFTILSK